MLAILMEVRLPERLENVWKGITVVQIGPVLWAAKRPSASHGLSWDLTNFLIYKSQPPGDDMGY